MSILDEIWNLIMGPIKQWLGEQLDYLISIPVNASLTIFAYFLLTASAISLLNALLSLFNARQLSCFLSHRIVWTFLSISLWIIYNSDTSNPTIGKIRKLQLIELNNQQGTWSNLIIGISLSYLSSYFCSTLFRFKFNENWKQIGLILLVLIVGGQLIFILINRTIESANLSTANGQPNVIVKDFKEETYFVAEFFIMLLCSMFGKRRQKIVNIMLLLAVTWFLVALRSYAVDFFHQKIFPQFNYIPNENKLAQKVLAFISAIIFIGVCSSSLEQNTRKGGQKQKYLFDAAMYYYYFMIWVGRVHHPQHYIAIIAVYMILSKRI